jgi:hypothetical protein
VTGLILKPEPCLLSLAKLLPLKWITVISCLYLYLSISIWVTTKFCNQVFRFLFLMPGFILLTVYYWLGGFFPALHSLVRQHFIENSLFVTVKDIEGNVS